MAPQPLTVHIRDGNSATLICPGCGLVRQIAAAKFRNDRHNRAIRCRCGTVFHVLLDFRRHFRKPTSLAGTYTSRDPGGPGSGVIRIVNISRSGEVVPGDIITAIDGKSVDSVGKLQSRLDDYRVGDTVRVTVLRRGKPSEIKVTLQPGT